jgi:hypothetical protein
MGHGPNVSFTIQLGLLFFSSKLNELRPDPYRTRSYKMEGPLPPLLTSHLTHTSQVLPLSGITWRLRQTKWATRLQLAHFLCLKRQTNKNKNGDSNTFIKFQVYSPRKHYCRICSVWRLISLLHHSRWVLQQTLGLIAEDVSFINFCNMNMNWIMFSHLLLSAELSSVRGKKPKSRVSRWTSQANKQAQPPHPLLFLLLQVTLNPACLSDQRRYQF